MKLGLDPTAPMVTLGWAVVLRKLRHFQELGHTAVLIVGDFTARVGDPSGKSETRRRLTAEEVRAFAEPLLEQFRRVLLPEPLEIRWNSEWLETLDMTEVLELTSTVTVAQMLERSDFANRYSEGNPISIMEFLYPLLQGYDSVAVRADVELGGSDQLWNLMMGRIIQTRYGQEPQVALTMPLLTGTDGRNKMSQSLGNYIGVTEPASEMFGKTMSIPDHLLGEWFRLAADRPAGEVDGILAGIEDGSRTPDRPNDFWPRGSFPCTGGPKRRRPPKASSTAGSSTARSPTTRRPSPCPPAIRCTCPGCSGPQSWSPPPARPAGSSTPAPSGSTGLRSAATRWSGKGC